MQIIYRYLQDIAGILYNNEPIFRGKPLPWEILWRVYSHYNWMFEWDMCWDFCGRTQVTQGIWRMSSNRKFRCCNSFRGKKGIPFWNPYRWHIKNQDSTCFDHPNAMWWLAIVGIKKHSWLAIQSYKQATNHGVWHEWSISKLRFQTWGDLGYPIFNQTHAEIPQH